MNVNAVNADIKSAFDQWLATRPESVQKLAKEFPPGTAIEVNGRKLYLLGYNENDMLIVSETWPGEDYKKANATKEYICASHVREGAMR